VASPADMVQAPRVRFQPRLQFLFCRLGLPSFSLAIAAFCLTLFIPVSFAQVVVNGQVFTNGLAIVDAPQPRRSVNPLHVMECVDLYCSGSSFSVGSDIPIAVDVSML
jgi:hypothetical protein